MKITKEIVPGTDLNIYQYKKHFRYGIDAILLSWYSSSKKASNVVDLCAGTGIVGYRHQAIYNSKKLYSIEIQKEMTSLFQKTVKEEDLREKIEIIPKDLKMAIEDFQTQSIDTVISNPPYLRKGDGKISDNPYQAQARHEISMKLEDLFIFSSKVLKDGGDFYLIHRPHRLSEIIQLGIKYQLPVKEILPVSSRIGADPQLILYSCKKYSQGDLVLKSPLIIYKEENYTDEILEIYKGAKRWKGN